MVLCWDTRTTQPCTPLVTGVCVGGGGGGGGLKHQRQFCCSYRIAGNFREHKFSRITNKHARKKISRFLFSRQGHDI